VENDSDEVTFEVIVAGAVGTPTYQWEVNDGGGWDEIIGATSSTYTTDPVEVSLDEYLYRCVVTDDEGSLTSNSATLFVVLDALNITVQPSSVEVLEGSTVEWTITVADGFTPYLYQWQVDVGAGFVNISGATSASYETPLLVLGDSGNEYRCVVRDSRVPRDTVTSNAAVLTVTEASSGSFLLLETGDYLLLETGDRILLEVQS
jgi:hypothetical protein